jgi:hypothetical protein
MVQCLLDEMEQNMDDSKTLTTSCALIRQHGLAHSWALLSSADSPRLMRLLVKAIRMHPSEVQLHKWALCIFSAVCMPVSERNAHASRDRTQRLLQCFYGAGGLEAMVTIISYNVGDAFLPGVACDIIRQTLQYVENISQETLKPTANAVAYCLNIRHARTDMISTVILVLGELVICVKKGSVERKMIKVLLEFVREHDLHDMEVHTDALKVILRFLQQEPRRAEIGWEAGILPVIVSFIERVLKLTEANGLNCEETVSTACIVIGSLYKSAPKPYVYAGLSVLPTAMVKFRLSRAFQQAAALTIAEILKNDIRNGDYLGQAGVMALLDATIRYGDRSDLWTVIFRSLCPIADKHPEWFAKEDFLRPFVKEMELHVQDISWQELACQLLGMITDDPVQPSRGLSEALINTGCVPHIVKAMQTHTRATIVSDIQTLGCLTLFFIVHSTLQNDSATKSRLVKEGAAHALIRAMSLRLNSEKVQTEGSHALYTLIRNHPENIRAVGKPVIRAVISAVLEWDVPRMHNAAIAAIHDVIVDVIHFRPHAASEYQDEVSRSGGIRAVTKHLKLWEGGMRDQLPIEILTASHDVLQFSCLDHKANQDQCSELGTMDVILRLMAKYKSEKDVQTAACMALHSLTRNHPANKAALLRHDGAKLFFRAKNMHLDDVSEAGILERMLKTLTAGSAEGQACIHVHMHVNVYLYTYTSTYTCHHARQAYLAILLYTLCTLNICCVMACKFDLCVHIRIRSQHLCMHERKDMYMCIYIYMCVCVCIHTYIYTYINVYASVQTHCFLHL